MHFFINIPSIIQKTYFKLKIQILKPNTKDSMIVELIILASIILLIASYMSNIYIAKGFENPIKYRLIICSLKSIIFLVIFLRMFICLQLCKGCVRNNKYFYYIQFCRIRKLSIRFFFLY